MQGKPDSGAIMGDMQNAIRTIQLPYADGLYDSQTALVIQKNRSREDIGTRSVKGVSLRRFTAKGWLYANSNKTDHKSIRKLAGILRSRNSGKESSKLLQPDPIKVDKKLAVKRDHADVQLEDKLHRVRDIFNVASAMDSRIADVRVNYSESIVERILVSQGGTEARQVIPRTSIGIMVVAKDNGVTDSDIARFGGTAGYEIVDTLTEQVVRETVTSAVEQLTAKLPPPGVHKVILDPGVVGTVCHESFGHGLEADQALRGRSYLKDMLGKKVASDIVTMYEDASLEGAVGSYYFDDDGTLSRKNTLVEDGKLVSFIHDMESAAAMNASLTGNSRTQSAGRRRFIRMTNTYAKPGEWNLEDIVKDTKEGVLMMHWRSGIEDPLGGGMQVVAGKGYLIANGQRTTPLKSMTLTGRVLDVLGNVDAVSKEGFEVGAGSCGKGAEDMVPVGSGGTWWRTTAVIA